MNLKLVGHHVGGRNASVSFLPPPPFQKDFVSVLYDADAACVEQILEKTADSGYAVRAFPYCLGAGKSSAYLNINYCSYASSLLDLNKRFASFYEFIKPLDYVYGDTMQTMERIPVEVTDLDTILSNDSDVPAPDFLSLDVEGMEFDVLIGAAEALNKNVLGVVSEIMFHEVREKQKTFDHIRPLLDDQGFDFVRFTYLHDFSPVRGPVGARGQGYQLAGDALFIRRLDTIPTMTEKVDEQFLLAVKLAFIAVNWGLLEYANEVFEWACSLDVNERHRKTIETTSYGRFLVRLDAAVKALPEAYPPLFSEAMDYETSRSRSTPSTTNAHTGWRYHLKEWLLKRPTLLNLFRETRYVLWAVRDTLEHLAAWLDYITKPRHSIIERLLIEHGLDRLAKTVRDRRKTEFPYVRKSR